MPTPAFIKEAAAQALEEGHTFYTENAGLAGLRRAIAEKYRELHGVRPNPRSEILIAAFGVQAPNRSTRCVIDPGDEAIVLTPASILFEVESENFRDPLGIVSVPHVES
jgi:aspartate/methionine/tyrosine aminotransferase